MGVRGYFAILLAVGALFTVGARDSGAQVGISESNQKKTIACGGQEAAVTGSLNDIIFTGECPAVTIKGSENTISIETVGQIRVVGTKNKVTWQRPIGDEKAPKVSKSGLGNVITQAVPPVREAASPSGARAPSAGAPSAGAPAGAKPSGAGKAAGKGAGDKPAGPAVVVSDEKATRTIDCRGRGVSVMGNGNTLTLRGSCGKVDVKGNENIISVDTVQSISATGNKNRVTWNRAAEGDQPDTSDLGNGNVIRRGTAPLP
jgi:hypothetical protein